jgi:hypothetical protein
VSRLVPCFVAALLAGACAAIGDAPQTIDEELPDGGVDEIEPSLTLRQSASETITAGNSISCIVRDTQDPPQPLEHKDDAYYRVFDLGALGLRDGFEVEAIKVGIETASSPTGSQPARVALHTLSGGFTVGNLTQLAAVDLQVANQNSQFLMVPIAASVPGSAKLVVEFSVPDSAGGKQLFWIGSNAEGQTAPSFWRSTACGQPEPGDLTALGNPNMHIVMSVIGERP